MLDSLNEVRLFCLYFVYFPRISASLREFKSQWNQHGMRTSYHQTPLSLWQTNMITASDESPLVNIDAYGIDYDGPVPDVNTDNNVVVPNSEVELSDEQFQYLKNHIDPLADDGDNGIEHFLRAVSIVDNFVNQE